MTERIERLCRICQEPVAPGRLECFSCSDRPPRKPGHSYKWKPKKDAPSFDPHKRHE